MRIKLISMGYVSYSKPSAPVYPKLYPRSATTLVLVSLKRQLNAHKPSHLHNTPARTLVAGDLSFYLPIFRHPIHRIRHFVRHYRRSLSMGSFPPMQSSSPVLKNTPRPRRPVYPDALFAPTPFLPTLWILPSLKQPFYHL
jgi:hypothetical protein